MNSDQRTLVDIYVKDASQITDFKDTIIDNYSYTQDPVELLIADPTYEDRVALEAIDNIETYGNWNDQFIKDSDLEIFVETWIEKDDLLKELSDRCEGNVFPYNQIGIDSDAIVEKLRDNSEASITLDDEEYLQINFGNLE